MGRMSLADIEDLLLQEEAEQKSKSKSPFAIPTLNEETQDDDIFAPKRTIFSSSPRDRRILKFTDFCRSLQNIFQRKHVAKKMCVLFFVSSEKLRQK